ncbi:hypothetical protein MCEZEM1_00579 [Comamonadaceae bacterium]
MATIRYTKDELFESLKRTRLRTVVVEGGDDLEVLRDIEARLAKMSGAVDFCVAGDKSTVLWIWEQRDQLPNSTVGFLADSDLWLFDNSRAGYPNVVFTRGYSIENICLGAQGLLDMVNARESAQIDWQHALNGLIDWFSSETAYYLSGANPILDVGIQQILETSGHFDLTPQAKARIQVAPAEFFATTRQIIRSNPITYIRGKQLFLALAEILNKHDGFRTPLKSLRAFGSRTENPEIENLIADLANSF